MPVAPKATLRTKMNTKMLTRMHTSLMGDEAAMESVVSRLNVDIDPDTPRRRRLTGRKRGTRSLRRLRCSSKKSR